MPRFPVLMLLVFALTLFTSATLLFLVEPMIGKMILPLLGGTPAVWNTCMVFFQLVLLLGYLYAHLSTTWLGPRKQAVLHMAMLLLPFVVLPVTVNSGLIKGDENPVYIVLMVLSLTVAVPMFVVCSSAPLLQKWFASTSHPAAKDPYFLYGASNLGSMLALIAYPTVIEPRLGLLQQSRDWSIGYGVLAALTALCAVFLWRSPRNVETERKKVSGTFSETETASPAIEKVPDTFFRSSESVHRGQHGIHAGGTRAEQAAPADVSANPAREGEVTWQRVLRWLALAFVPSSLMLGTTTYITTDIASIPLFWVAPLALYLLSFILVFSRLPGWIHKVLVLVLPLCVLLLLFFMLSGLVPTALRDHWVSWSTGMHLTTLFIVSMVCHGELARDRPATRYLTGYFLWMSVGGVLGGLFNGLAAPLLFKGIVEYELAMLLACYLTPPLPIGKESSWGRRIDVALAALFAGVGALLVGLRLHDKNLRFEVLSTGSWRPLLAALLAGLAIGGLAAWRGRGRPFDRWMDLLSPMCLGLLLVGLVWGLDSSALRGRVEMVANSIDQNKDVVYNFLSFGAALVMCYTFVERSLRFALGVGALLVMSSFCALFNENLQLHQERSFFGVLKVDQGSLWYGDRQHTTRSLIHGTTWHGMQVQSDELRNTPLTYYHFTGPIGEIMAVYNSPEDDRRRGGMRNLAVLGLGTGTMACFARPGQHLTFYDIDPVIRRLSYDEGDPYFTFVRDAKKRGAHVDLIMGDARLMMERTQLKPEEKYGIMLMDAFSSDAIPIHLLTLEALDIYLDKLAPDGLLIFHISNRHIDLRPVLYNLAKERNLATAYQSDDRYRMYPGKTASSVVVLARKVGQKGKIEHLDPLFLLNDWEDQRIDLQMRLALTGALPRADGLGTQALLLAGLLNQDFFERADVQWQELQPDEGKKDEWEKVGLWTDDYSNLLSVLGW